MKKEILQEKIDNIRGAVMMSYPMGLPEHDIVRHNLECNEDLAPAVGPDYLDPETCTLWFAGKEFFRDQVRLWG